MKKDFRQEAARFKDDWKREKENLEAALDRALAVLAMDSASLTKESIEKATILEKSIRRHLAERERSVCLAEKKSCLEHRLAAIAQSYAQLDRLFVYLDLVAQLFLSIHDLVKLDDFTKIFPPAEDSNSQVVPSKDPPYKNIYTLDGILTDWQASAARILERELLAPRRIGSLCFLSGENALLGMKLSCMVRICIITPNIPRAQICTKLANIWREWHRSYRLNIKSAHLQPQEVMDLGGNRFDALFLDYEILASWMHEYPSSYADTLAALEHVFPFLIFLLKKDQVASHREILSNMHLETHAIFPSTLDSEISGEEVTTLLIARRQSRYILHYARDSWDIIVRDFGWNAAPALDSLPETSSLLPNPYHLSEKVLLVSNLGLRVVSTSAYNSASHSAWLSQREAACWRKFGGQISEFPRLLSESRTHHEWKIVLQLEEGDWRFARDPQSTDHMLAQTQSLLRTLSWLRERSIFLNNLRVDMIALNGPKFCFLSLERLDFQETEDTLSSLLWFWYDLGRGSLPLRPWPIRYFPETNLAKIPELLQPIAHAAASSASLDEFLQNPATLLTQTP